MESLFEMRGGSQTEPLDRNSLRRCGSLLFQRVFLFWHRTVKRSTLIDGRGVPLAIAVDGANVPDCKLVAQTLDAIPVQRPEPTSSRPTYLCLDKGYGGKPVDSDVCDRGYTPHVPRKANQPPKPSHHGETHRWKVERTHSWLNRARRLLIRWEKKVANYLGFLHLQSAIATLKTAKVFG